MDPIIEEMQRARLPIQPHVWAHWLNYLAVDVQPRLDRLEELEHKLETIERGGESKLRAEIFRNRVKR